MSSVVLAATPLAQNSNSQKVIEEPGTLVEGRRPVIKEGGWSERIGLSRGELEFNVHWDLRVRDYDDQSVRSQTRDARHPDCRDDRHGRKKGPRMHDPLPEIPEEWGSRIHAQELRIRDGAADCVDAGLAEEHSDHTSSSFMPRSVGDLLLRPTGGPTVVLHDGDQEEPRLHKTEPSYLKDPETVLSTLSEPLQVVYTIDPADAAANLDHWLGAIQKEVDAVQVAVRRVLPGTAEYRSLVQDPTVARVPTKLVYTVKPPQQGSAAVADEAIGSVLENPDAYFRRKARLVCCGNFAPQTGLAAYASGSTPDALRLVLTEASFNAWCAAILDITSAFLATPVPTDGSMPRVVVTPPGAVKRLNLAQDQEVWLLVRALYGLREAPRLWALHRDSRLKEISVSLEDGSARLAQSTGEENLWLILVRDGSSDREQVRGYLLVYVDDFLFAAEKWLIVAMSNAVMKVWKTSALCIASPEEPIRFVGLDIACIPGGFRVCQQGYIEEVARLHDWSGHAKTPVTREDACYEVLPSDAEPLPETVLQAQTWAGEVLWIAQRSRPDVSFASGLISSLCTRAPERSIRIAQRTLSYLLDTRHWSMYYLASGSQLAGFGDASFSPEGGRSQTGWCVYFRSCAISWRSARQSLTTLSTAEAELVALQETALSLTSVESMLEAASIKPASRIIFSDSTAALAIQQGSSSFRTRHLKVRASWVREQLDDGFLMLEHRRGDYQLADLLTKPLASPRIRELANLWSLLDHTAHSQGFPADVASRRALIALIILLSAVPAQAQEDDDSGLKSDAELYMLATLVVLASLAVWEGLKACWRNCVAPRFLGSQSRQALRLRRLQEAVEQELHAQLGSSSSTSEHHTPERRPRPSDVPSMPAWGEDRSRVRRPRQVALGSPRVQSNPASSAPDRLMTPVRSITNPRSPDPRFMSAPARSTRLQTSPALSTGAREIGVQTDYETPQVVERFIPTYPNSVFVTSGRSYHLNASCQAVAKAGSVREAPLCGYCRGG